MADRKITDLTALTTPASADVLPIVDVSEAAAADKNKKVTVGELFKGIPDGTAAAPAIAFESDDGNGLFLSTTDTIGIATNGVSRATVSTTAVTSTLPVIVPDGSAAAPSVAFTGSGTDTGLYSPGADQVAISTGGTGRLFIDSTGRVGIGTSSPSNILQVTSSATAAVPSAGASGHFFAVGSSAYGITGGALTNGNSYFQVTRWDGTATNYDLLLQPNGGRVGIGTTSPVSILDVTVGGSGTRKFLANYDDSQITIKGSNDSSNPETLRLVADNIRFNTGTTGSGTERARIDSSGRLLVGTSTSRVVEDLLGNGPQGLIQIEATNSDAIMSIISAGTSDAGRAGTLSLGRHRNSTVGGTPTIVQNGDTLGAICFAGGDGTDMRTKGASIAAQVDGTPGVDDMPGRLVFSTTADGASSPTERMRVNSAGSVFTFTNSSGYVGVANAGNNAAEAGFAFFKSSTGISTGTLCMQVKQDGDLENTNNSYGAISDLKLKENIVDANSQWNDIKSLQVRKFNFKVETNYGTHTQIGLIAQEVELVSPGLVSESPDRDEDGNDLGTVTKSVNYSVLYMKAVKALQEAMERIETLEAKVAALETK